MAESLSGGNRVGAGRGGSPVTRAAVLSAALEIVDRDGVEGLSMRRLAEAVGRDPMVIYRHVPNKAAVIDGVAEVVFTELSVDAAASDWVAEVRRVAREFRRVALAHPRAVPLLVTRPLATPLGQRPCGDGAPAGGHAGVADTGRIHRGRRVAHLSSAVRVPVRACAQRVAGTRGTSGGDRRSAAAGVISAADREFPLVRGLASVLASYDGAAELERGLDILLAGLAATLPGPGNAPVPGRAMPCCPGRRTRPRRVDRVPGAVTVDRVAARAW